MGLSWSSHSENGADGLTGETPLRQTRRDWVAMERKGGKQRVCERSGNWEFNDTGEKQVGEMVRSFTGTLSLRGTRRGIQEDGGGT